MKFNLLWISFLLSVLSFAQEVKKENLSKKVNLYWDYHKTQPQASGYYYVDELGETTEKQKELYQTLAVPLPSL